VEYVKWVSSGCPVGVQWVGGWACVCGVYVGGRAKASFERHSAMARATKVVALGATTSIEVRGVCVSSSCVCVSSCVCASSSCVSVRRARGADEW